jgi:hypothetical protein
MADSSGGMVGGPELNWSDCCISYLAIPVPILFIGQNSNFREHGDRQQGLLLRRRVERGMLVCATGGSICPVNNASMISPRLTQCFF